jgi:hypothetical protein
MSPAAARRLLHTSHGVTSLALIATGFLILWPDLRARLLGGYGRELAQVHLGLGWAFAVAPLLALGAARALFEDLRRRLGPPEGITWQKLHIGITLAASALLTASGIVLGHLPDLPLAVQDASLDAHIWATWVVAASLPLHLVAARRKIAERVRLLAGGEPPPLFEFADGEDDAPDP